MVKIRTCIVAEDVIRDADSNRLSAINIVDNITPLGYPFLLTKLVVLVIAERSPGDERSASVILKMRSDTKGEVLRMPIPLDFQSFVTTRYMLRLQNVVSENPSRITVEIFAEDNQPPLASYFFDLLPPPVAPAPPVLAPSEVGAQSSAPTNAESLAPAGASR